MIVDPKRSMLKREGAMAKGMSARRFVDLGPLQN